MSPYVISFTERERDDLKRFLMRYSELKRGEARAHRGRGDRLSLKYARGADEDANAALALADKIEIG